MRDIQLSRPVLIALVGAILVGGFLYFKSSQSSDVTAPAPVTTADATPATGATGASARTGKHKKGHKKVKVVVVTPTAATGATGGTGANFQA